MAKETFYFSHDYNSRGDRKMVSLLMNCGVEGIGIYWCVIEMLYEEGGYLMLSECDRIAFELRTQSDIVCKVIHSSLFCRDDEKFWSESALHRLSKRKHISETASVAANIRWENERKMRSHSDSNANKVKESKLKEIKKKEIKQNPCRYTDFDKLKSDAAAAFKKHFLFVDFLKDVGENKINELAMQFTDRYINKDINDFGHLIKGWSDKFIIEKKNGIHFEESKSEIFSKL